MRRSLPYSLILVPVFSGLILYQILYTPSPDELLAPTYDSGVGSSVDYIFNNMAASNFILVQRQAHYSLHQIYKYFDTGVSTA